MAGCSDDVRYSDGSIESVVICSIDPRGGSISIVVNSTIWHLRAGVKCRIMASLKAQGQLRA